MLVHESHELRRYLAILAALPQRAIPLARFERSAAILEFDDVVGE
jgi:hypothetical protein